MLSYLDDHGNALPLPDDNVLSLGAVELLLPRLRFSDLNRLRLDTIPRVLREKAKALAVAQGLDIVTAMRAAGMEPDEDGPTGAPVLVPPDGTDPTSGLPAFVPGPMPQHDDEDESELLEPTPLEVVKPFDANKEGSAEPCATTP